VSPDEPLFLDVDDILEIHEAQLEIYGGSAGLRDRGLLDSAVAQPQTSFGGEFAHDGLFAMAAAYLFHIVRNHAFVDGNKRAGMLAAVVFLDVNGISIAHPSDALYELTMGVAEGRVEKAAIAAELERIARAKP
jgi:death-on-curing protein